MVNAGGKKKKKKSYRIRKYGHDLFMTAGNCPAAACEAQKGESKKRSQKQLSSMCNKGRNTSLSSKQVFKEKNIISYILHHSKYIFLKNKCV